MTHSSSQPGAGAPAASSTSIDPDALLDLALRSATAAGEELLRRYGNVKGLDSKSSATDPVSDADRAAEALLVEMISAERPDDGILGEEGADRPSRSGLRWVIDPLDGTVNYIYGIDEWAVSVAIEDAQGPLVGVVHNPVAGRTYTGVRGGGAFVDGRPIRVNDPVPAERALLATGFSYQAERRVKQSAFMASLLPRIRDIRRIGSAALDVCMVADGQVDAFFEEGVNWWDVAAGTVIAREAGAIDSRVSPAGAAPGFLFAGPALHAELTTLFDDYRSA